MNARRLCSLREFVRAKPADAVVAAGPVGKNRAGSLRAGWRFPQGRSAAMPAAPRFVCVGRLGEHKAQLVLVEAVHQLKEKGVHCEVVLAGDGPMRPAVEKAIRDRGLERQITITGWVSGERVKAEIAAARALILPSFSENMPVVIMEAMALGRPVISTYIAGIPELLEAGKSGWLVPSSDVDALAQAIGECCGGNPGRAR